MTDLIKQAAVAAAKEQIDLLNEGQNSFLFGDAWIGQLAEIIKRHYEPLERETRRECAEQNGQLTEALARFRNTAGKHDGEHDTALTVCSRCNESYVIAEAELDRAIKEAS